MKMYKMTITLLLCIASTFILKTSKITEAAVALPAEAASTTSPAPATRSGNSSEYAYIYNIGTQTMKLNESVLFDHNGAISSGITHSIGTSDIILIHEGIYLITFYAYGGTHHSSFGLFLNDRLVDGGLYGVSGVDVVHRGQVIIEVEKKSVVTVRFYFPEADPKSPCYSIQGSLQNSISRSSSKDLESKGCYEYRVNASITIVKID